MFTVQFFISQARRWNHALIVARRLNEPDAERLAYKRHREASLARARAFKSRAADLAAIALHEADNAALRASCAL